MATLGQPPLGATAPGTVQGQFSVGDDGSGRYEVPLETPRGRNGVQPHLALVYNSRSGNGPLGPGWSIKGLSRIERCPRNPATAIDRQMETKPVTFDANDELCLDGELLIRQGDGSTGLGEYRTQRDNFARVLVASADDLGPLEFSVYRKDGLIESYGSDAQSRLEATQQTPIATNDRAPIQMSSRTVRVAWGLDRVADRYGNAMTVTYKTKLSPEEGMGFTANLGLNPLRISYTSNDVTSRAATRFVDFIYDTALSDPQELFSAGVLTYRLLRLRSIAMSGPNPFTTAPLWSYQLTYLAPSITERQLLSRVTKCDPQNKCMAPIQFGWEAGSLNFNVTDSGIGDAYNASFNFGAVQSMETQSRMLEGLDVDGDGRDDLIYRLVIPQTTSKSFAEIDVNDAAWRVRVSNGSTFGPEVDPGISFTTTQQREAAFYPTAMPIDLNGDGRVDIAIYNTKFSADVGSPFDLYRATSGGTFVREPAGLSGTNFADPVQNPEYDRPGTMGNLVTLDLSGTGTPIIFRAIGRNIEGITPMRDTYAWRPYSSAGVVPYTLLNALLPGGGVVFEEIQMTGTPIVGDLDGDGRWSSSTSGRRSPHSTLIFGTQRLGCRGPVSRVRRSPRCRSTGLRMCSLIPMATDFPMRSDGTMTARARELSSLNSGDTSGPASPAGSRSIAPSLRAASLTSTATGETTFLSSNAPIQTRPIRIRSHSFRAAKGSCAPSSLISRSLWAFR